MATLTLTAGSVEASISPSNASMLAHIEDLARAAGLDPTGYTAQQKADWFLQWIRSEVIQQVDNYRSNAAHRAVTHVAADLDNES